TNSIDADEALKILQEGLLFTHKKMGEMYASEAMSVVGLGGYEPSMNLRWHRQDHQGLRDVVQAEIARFEKIASGGEHQASDFFISPDDVDVLCSPAVYQAISNLFKELRCNYLQSISPGMSVLLQPAQKLECTYLEHFKKNESLSVEKAPLRPDDEKALVNFLESLILHNVVFSGDEGFLSYFKQEEESSQFFLGYSDSGLDIIKNSSNNLPDRFKPALVRSQSNSGFYIKILAQEVEYYLSTSSQGQLVFSQTCSQRSLWHFYPCVTKNSKFQRNYLVQDGRAIGYSSDGEHLSLVSLFGNKNKCLFTLYLDDSFIVKWCDRLLRAVSSNKTYATIRESLCESGRGHRLDGAVSLQLRDSLREQYENQVIDFVFNILPALRSAESKKIIYVMGNSGVGKSSLVNYLLGHDFITDEFGIDLREVKNKALPHAAIGRNAATSETIYPQAYMAGNYTYCDCPGFGETRKSLVGLQYFSMALTHNLAESVKGIIIVISADEVKAARAETFKRLCFDLQALIDIKSATPNLLFVLNNKGDTRFRYSYYTTIIDQCREQFREYLKTVNDLIEELTDSKNQRPDTKSIDRLKKWIQANIGKRVLKLDVGVSDSVPRHKVETYLEIAREIKTDIVSAIDILSLISEHNSVIWRGHDIQDCQAAILSKLDAMTNTSIPKSSIRFELRTEESNNFESWLIEWASHYQLQFENVKTRKAQMERKLRELLLPKQDLQDLLENFKTYQEDLKNNLSHLASYLQETKYQDVLLTGRPYSFFGNWWPECGIKPYRFHYVEDAKLKVVPYTKILCPRGKESGVVSSIKIAKNGAKAICQKNTSENSELGNGTRTINGKNYPLYISFQCNYRSENIFTSIPPDLKVGEYWGLQLDHPSSKLNFVALILKIKKTLTDLKSMLTRCSWFDTIPPYSELFKSLDRIVGELDVDFWSNRTHCLSLLLELLPNINTFFESFICEISSICNDKQLDNDRLTALH
ncbi:MAG: GTPase domain-containing protein, partial [Flavobacteriales bacterium]|nr:GTPase domain-containing protein [Flavobacteriales bacterium]